MNFKETLFNNLQSYFKLGFQFFCCSFQMPYSTEEWLQISDEFEHNWNFPHAIGAIDGKHINIQAPINSATGNYKGFFFNIFLIGVVDTNCNFIFADVGCQGRISDGGVFKKIQFCTNSQSTNSFHHYEKKSLDCYSKRI